MLQRKLFDVALKLIQGVTHSGDVESLQIRRLNRLTTCQILQVQRKWPSSPLCSRLLLDLGSQFKDLGPGLVTRLLVTRLLDPLGHCPEKCLLPNPLSLLHHHRLHLHLLLFDPLPPLLQPHPHGVQLATKKIILARYAEKKNYFHFSLLKVLKFLEVNLGERPLTLLGVPGPELWIELPVPRVLPRRDFGESSRSSEKVMLIPLLFRPSVAKLVFFSFSI